MTKEAFLTITVITASTAFAFLNSPTAVLDKCDVSDSTMLNCSGFGLKVFPSDDMDRYSSYTTLDFSYNLITNISRLSFSSANHVVNLNLANNRINKIEPNAFGNFVNLKALDLTGNQLDGHKIREEQFKILGRLRNLSMRGNPLRFIRKNTFNFMELPRLKFLDLSHCAVTVIEEEGITLTNLEQLDLSWNSLKAFPTESLKMMNDLRILILSHNKIKILDDLPSLPEIRILNFDYNMINNVTMRDEVWDNADSLEKLYIRGNNIIRFTAGSFPWDLETLKGIYLDDNPIHCDCRMKWVAKEEDMYGRNYTIPCEFPTEHKGKNLLTIPSEELRCSTSVFKILILMGLSIVVVLCFILMVVVYMRRRKYKKGKKPRTKTVKGSSYTAVYTKDDDDDVRVHISDEKSLLSQRGTEFDV